MEDTPKHMRKYIINPNGDESICDELRMLIEEDDYDNDEENNAETESAVHNADEHVDTDNRKGKRRKGSEDKVSKKKKIKKEEPSHTKYTGTSSSNSECKKPNQKKRPVTRVKKEESPKKKRVTKVKEEETEDNATPLDSAKRAGFRAVANLAASSHENFDMENGQENIVSPSLHQPSVNMEQIGHQYQDYNHGHHHQYVATPSLPPAATTALFTRGMFQTGAPFMYDQQHQHQQRVLFNPSSGMMVNDPSGLGIAGLNGLISPSNHAMMLSGGGIIQEEKQKRTHAPRACDHCKDAHTKCVKQRPDLPCMKCVKKGIKCTMTGTLGKRGRKPMNAAGSGGRSKASTETQKSKRRKVSTKKLKKEEGEEMSDADAPVVKREEKESKARVKIENNREPSTPSRAPNSQSMDEDISQNPFSLMMKYDDDHDDEKSSETPRQTAARHKIKKEEPREYYELKQRNCENVDNLIKSFVFSDGGSAASASASSSSLENDNSSKKASKILDVKSLLKQQTSFSYEMMTSSLSSFSESMSKIVKNSMKNDSYDPFEDHETDSTEGNSEESGCSDQQDLKELVERAGVYLVYKNMRKMISEWNDFLKMANDTLFPSEVSQKDYSWDLSSLIASLLKERREEFSDIKEE